jgi:hypothetical protein
MMCQMILRACHWLAHCWILFRSTWTKRWGVYLAWDVSLCKKLLLQSHASFSLVQGSAGSWPMASIVNEV